MGALALSATIAAFVQVFLTHRLIGLRTVLLAA
jgi:hypothetical protein